ncbi:hypothetical protein BT96DRAFT_156003 [Gymnopus androsaceus JB14]|uniref:Uncharacterized protein n=1 Tax=Gymnopus androsaceus JB14 TaxID=1447944 RepID=A0A6A4HAL8_9AGAR|nr:hypothetical protein BT96DRAFT_156003 [Gymnopus androsaceus JB14]
MYCRISFNSTGLVTCDHHVEIVVSTDLDGTCDIIGISTRVQCTLTSLLPQLETSF